MDNGSRLRGLARRGVSVAAAVLWASTACREASANGRFPGASAIVFDPHDAAFVYVRTTSGLFVSHNSGNSFSSICEAGIGFTGTADPTYVVTASGAVLAGLYNGFAISRDRGCDWSFTPYQDDAASLDLTARANDVYALMISRASASAGTPFVVVSHDDGRTFSRTGAPLDPAVRFETIDAAPSDPQRLYLSGSRGGESLAGVLLVSRDGGASWAERSIPLRPTEQSAFISAVDPHRADRIYVRTSGAIDASSQLLVTDDAGNTWKQAYRAYGPLLGFALSPDGREVYLGWNGGVVAASTRTLAFEQRAKFDLRCLAASGAALWACGNDSLDAFLAGASKDKGRTFQARASFRTVGSQPDCAPQSSVERECGKGAKTTEAPAAVPPQPAPSAESLSAAPSPSPPDRSQLGRWGILGVGIIALVVAAICRRSRRPLDRRG